MSELLSLIDFVVIVFFVVWMARIMWKVHFGDKHDQTK